MYYETTTVPLSNETCSFLTYRFTSHYIPPAPLSLIPYYLGNLIRTPEGKLAILDFGLMTQITDNQKFGMIEAISHLVHRDYEGIGDDFKRLDFIPEEARRISNIV